MSDYEWDGWLDERLVVFGVHGQKREKRKAHEEDTHRFRFLFFQGVARRSIESEEGEEEGEEDEELVSDSRQRMNEKPR